LIAGEGKLPRAIAQEARSQGYSVVVVAVKDLANDSPEQYADAVAWIKPGKAETIVNFLKENSAGEVVFAGKFPKTLLFIKSALSPDMRLLRFLFHLKDKGDDTILNAVSKELQREGIKLMDVRDFSRGLLTPEGALTPNAPTEDEWKDIEYGYRLAKEVGRLEIGQTVVVKGQAVVAVEAAEGTDETILRGGHLANGGAVVVKVSRPEQDMRLDVPAVGLRTLECMIKARVRVLALEAGSSIFLDRDEFTAKAEQSGIAVVGINKDTFKKSSKS